MGGIRNFVDATARAGVALRAMLNGSATELFSVAAATGETHAARLGQISTPNLIGSDNDTAAAVAYSGEFKSAQVLIGSAAALTTNVAQTVTQLSLQPGRWLVGGVIGFIPDTTASVSSYLGGASLTTNVSPVDGQRIQVSSAAGVPGALRTCLALPEIEIAVPSLTTTQIYLVGACTFTVSAVGVFGKLTARRI